jgi:hypothetical protein
MLDRRIMLAGVFAFAGGQAAEAQPAASGEALAARLVEAMGGDAAWRRARGLVIAATHYEPQLTGPYDNRLAIALDEPRMRFEGRSAWGMRRTRAVVGARGWRVSEVSALGPMTPEQVTGDLDWWEAHPYRNVRRLAVGDPGVRPRAGQDGRLELTRPDGSQLMWYRLGVTGEPYAFGAGEGSAGVVLGPLDAVPGGVRLPLWSARMDGTFRASGQKGQVLPDWPQVDWDKP